MTSGSISGRPDRPARERLLDAGVHLISGDLSVVIRRGLTAGTVCAVAGVARRTFYDQFDTVDEYMGELAAYAQHELAVAASPEPVSLDDVEGDITVAVTRIIAGERRWQRENASLAQAVRRLGRSAPMLATATNWSALIDDLVDLLLARRLDRDDIASNARSATAALVAARQHDQADLDSGADAIVALLAILIGPNPVNEAVTVELWRARVRSAWTERSGTVDVPNVRHLVVTATQQLLVKRGARSLSVDEISAMTGLSPPTITHYVGAVRQLLAAVVDDIAAGLDVRLTATVNAGTAPRDALVRHVADLRATAGDHPYYPLAALALADIEGADWQRSASRGRARLGRLVTDLSRRLWSTADGTTAVLLEQLALNPAMNAAPLEQDGARPAVVIDTVECWVTASRTTGS